MAKFRMKLKLQGLELEIEGSREDASLISQSVGQQIAGLLQPVGNIIEGDAVQEIPSSLGIAPPAPASTKKTKRRKSSENANAGDETSPAIDFKHSPEKYGNPKQHWKTADKSIWLLYVAKESANVSELSSANISNTFNRHFRQSGQIQTGHVGRDLGRLKISETPSPVGEDTTKSPSAWYLTDAGIKRAQTLVAEALGHTQQNQPCH